MSQIQSQVVSQVYRLFDSYWDELPLESPVQNPQQLCHWNHKISPPWNLRWLPSGTSKRCGWFCTWTKLKFKGFGSSHASAHSFFRCWHGIGGTGSENVWKPTLQMYTNAFSYSSFSMLYPEVTHQLIPWASRLSPNVYNTSFTMTYHDLQDVPCPCCLTLLGVWESPYLTTPLALSFLTYTCLTSYRPPVLRDAHRLVGPLGETACSRNFK